MRDPAHRPAEPAVCAAPGQRTVAPAPATTAAFMADAAERRLRLSRIRWRCRRGMLENDLILSRFLDAFADTLTEQDIVDLDALLDLTDNALWDVIAGRAEPEDAALGPFVARVRMI